MSDLSRKILESGLIDETTARMMEKWGVLDEGSADLAKKATLKDATREELIQFAEDIGEEVDKQRRLKETMLDLNHIRWPVKLTLVGRNEAGGHQPVSSFTAVVDRMGRFYFRPQEVKPYEKDFIPGRHLMNDDTQTMTILEVTPLYVGDDLAAIQVSVQ
jgi:hypothetical protein